MRLIRSAIMWYHATSPSICYASSRRTDITGRVDVGDVTSSAESETDHNNEQVSPLTTGEVSMITTQFSDGAMPVAGEEKKTVFFFYFKSGGEASYEYGQKNSARRTDVLTLYRETNNSCFAPEHWYQQCFFHRRFFFFAPGCQFVEFEASWTLWDVFSCTILMPNFKKMGVSAMLTWKIFPGEVPGPPSCLTGCMLKQL